MTNSTSSTAPQDSFDAAVQEWIAENFTSGWKPSVAMVKTQLDDSYGIDSVNQLKKVGAAGGLEFLKLQYYSALNQALDAVDEGKLKGISEEV